MPRIDEFTFDAEAQKALDLFKHRLSGANIPPRKVKEVFDYFVEVDPLTYSFDDGGKAATAHILRIATDMVGLSDQQAEQLVLILKGMQDGAGDFLGNLLLNMITPGPEIDPNNLPPDIPIEVVNAADGKKISILYFSDVDLLGLDDESGIQVSSYRYVNPCELIYLTPAGAPAVIPVPGWACLVGALTILAGLLGDGDNFLDRIVSGVRKVGRELRRAGKKLLKKLKL